MTSETFQRCAALARTKADLTNADMSLLFGCGLKGYKAVTVPIESAAQFIRHQCIYFNGETDGEAFNEVAQIFRRKVSIA